MKRLLLIACGLLALSAIAVSIAVELEAPYRRDTFGSATAPRAALVLYHPSRDAGFSDELSLAFAQAAAAAGLRVDRATLTAETPARPVGYELVAVVTNTYYWSPDLPTLRYLERARLEGMTVVGIVGGAGSTTRAERLLGEALRKTGGRVFATTSVWMWRPNDETRMDAPNREVALAQVRALAARALRQQPE
ncbi:MAG: hypothetical protein MUF53_08860 [Gemmatimonadaceae bacterium]|jgi:hypothetical protein|nr:hypothetical protein [Gemmatimonadaceae bacterium]